MEEKIFDLEKYAGCARQAAAEGAVLLKNDEGALPLAKGTKVALFGRSLYNYYKSGTGSGGLVNVTRVVGILDAVRESGQYIVNENINSMYEAWLKEHPYDAGAGWGGEPWFQEEMPLEDKVVERAAEESQAAVIVIGRTAGEDQDNKAEPGSYLLTEAEKDMLKKVCGRFKRSIVLLNVGNIIDMKWVQEYDPSAVLYVWQGGQEGGLGVLDVLNGAVSPCGKLSDTIARDISDYPSTANYGGTDQNIYQEDIYVGYRYFETFCPEKVLYPFGYGLSYTQFAVEQAKAEAEEASADGKIRVSADVKNTGSVPGKEVFQVYVEKPQGKLGQPVRSLCGYTKTKELQPGEHQKIEVSFDWYSISSYDDDGSTGYKSCYVLEKGDYTFYAGTDVRSAGALMTAHLPETTVIRRLEEVLACTKDALRMHPVWGSEEKSYQPELRPMPVSTASWRQRRLERLPKESLYTGDKGYKLVDVRDGRVSMDGFIVQLSDEDLCAIIRGEGMNSPKVTPGTGGAFGGLTESLKRFGIPVGCCSDGPSGIRMDCGAKAFSLPSGTCLACTFNDELNTELFSWEGLELRKNRIDVLLGPGMNIHRNPLNGRNFEYFSEDPLLTGKIGAAQLKGMHKYQVTGTIKHFACNNQEYRRSFVNGVISERALREIYLKGFEIAVREAGAYCVMSTYGPVNGIHTASSYDLLTTVLRNEWGFRGIVMTDWWAKGNEGGEPGDKRNTPQIARAQNDLYMVVADAASNSSGDRSLEGLLNGTVTRGELQRNAANICETLMRMPAFSHFLGEKDDLEDKLKKCLSMEDEALSSARVILIENGKYELEPSVIGTEKGTTNLFQIFTSPRGIYRLSLTCRADTSNVLAQIPLSVFQEQKLSGMVSLTGADQEEKTFEFMLEPAFMGNFYLKLYFGQSGMKITKCVFENVKDMEEEIKSILAQI